jgi:large subunit ribosomal protein L14
MKPLSAKVTKGLCFMSKLSVCDNSGAKIIKLISVIGKGTRKGRIASAGVGDLIQASVISGKVNIRKQVVYAIIVRQKKEYKRRSGISIKFEDNAAVVLKDNKGNPRGTILKGPIAKEVGDRWTAITKLASIVI